MTLEAAFAPRLLHWFDAHGRHTLPWQHPRSPYRVWLSEIMLQQTQVAVAIPYFERFTTALPNLPALAAATQDDVLALWSGLGYYTRARNLHATARRCVEHHAGALPRDLDALIALPGIGRSTAGAILAQAWGERFPILDGNVKRVLCRLLGINQWPGSTKIEAQLWDVARALLPTDRLADYTQAQMDFGATLCTRANPECQRCPLQDRCIAWCEQRVHELPVPKPRKVRPQRDTHLLMLTDAFGRVLLQRRPPVGVWASLWSLPEFAASSDLDAWLERHTQPPASNRISTAPLLHNFSHFQLRIHPHLTTVNGLNGGIMDNDTQRWVTRAELAALGLPAPIRRLILEH